VTAACGFESFPKSLGSPHWCLRASSAMEPVETVVTDWRNAYYNPSEHTAARLPCRGGAKIQTPSTTSGICGPSLAGGRRTTLLQSNRRKAVLHYLPVLAEGRRGLTPPSNRRKCADLPALATQQPCTCCACTYVIQCTNCPVRH